MAFRGKLDDPIRNFKFRVTIDGFGGRTGFSSVEGLKETTEVVEYREGTDAATPRKLFGQTTFDNVTLQRGITNDLAMLNWRRNITNTAAGSGLAASAEGDGGTDVRREVQIDLVEYHGRTTWMWVLLEAWPTEFETSGFSGDGNEVVIESLVLAHEGMEVTRNG